MKVAVKDSFRAIVSSFAKSGRIIREDGSGINQADVCAAQIGADGAEFISDAIAHTTTGVFTSLQIIEDSVISAYEPAFTGNSLIGVSLSQGLIIYGRFTSITLSSGKILAYKGV